MSSLQIYILAAFCFLAESSIGQYTNSCEDTSFSQRFEVDNRGYGFLSNIKTKDGGILMSGNSWDQPQLLFNHTIINKFDSLGHNTWSTEIRAGGTLSNYVTALYEMKDGSFILAGGYHSFLNRGDPDSRNYLRIIKISSTGEVIWLKTFLALALECQSASSLIVQKITEGKNGDILLASTNRYCPEPRQIVVYRLDVLGNAKWSTTLPFNDGNGGIFGIGFENDNVFVSSWMLKKAEKDTHIDFMYFDYDSGDFINNKSWQANASYANNYAVSVSLDMVKIDNGHYILTSLLDGDISNGNNVPHIGVLEFDENQEFLKGYAILSSINTGYPQTVVRVDHNGDIRYSLSEYITRSHHNIYIGSVKNEQIISQRVKTYLSQPHGIDQIIPFDNGTYAYIKVTSAFDATGFFLEYNKLKDNDKPGVCLGTINNFSYLANFQHIPYQFTPQGFIHDNLYISNHPEFIFNTYSYSSRPPCSETGCDTLKIHGMAAVCGLSKDINFSAYRSSTCNMPVKWYVKDANVPVKPLNDTTVNLQFSSAGQAWLFAEMPSECSIIKDSLLISVSDAAHLELGSDVQLCQGDSAVFDAGSGFAEYLWSNGTTDQKLIVKSNGRFSCIGTAGNGCKSYDTVSMILKDCVPGFFMPNAFSPNHDGKNDVFKPNIGGVLLRYEFSIFNRWGQRIFTTKNRNAGWDGTQRNKTSDSEVFVWSCTYQFQGSPVKTEKGTVVIIR